jgi:hypothetical protein
MGVVANVGAGGGFACGSVEGRIGWVGSAPPVRARGAGGTRLRVLCIGDNAILRDAPMAAYLALLHLILAVGEPADANEERTLSQQVQAVWHKA